MATRDTQTIIWHLVSQGMWFQVGKISLEELNLSKRSAEKHLFATELPEAHIDQTKLDEMIEEMSATKIMLRGHWLEYSNGYSEWYQDALKALQSEPMLGIGIVKPIHNWMWEMIWHTCEPTPDTQGEKYKTSVEKTLIYEAWVEEWKRLAREKKIFWCLWWKKHFWITWCDGRWKCRDCWKRWKRWN